MHSLTRAATAAAFIAALAGPAAADKGLEGLAGLDGEVLLVPDKVIAGIGGYYFFHDMVGIDLGFSLIFLDEERPQSAVEGTFLGSLMTAHLMFGFPVADMMQLRVGTGIDYYALWGIDDEETLAAMPVVGELRIRAGKTLNVFVQPRYYLFHSDGLEPGVDVDGKEEAPFVISVGVGGSWQ